LQKTPPALELIYGKSAQLRAHGVWHPACEERKDFFNLKPHQAMNATIDHCISICNKLLRGEISAVETYEQAIEKHSDSFAASELQRIHSEHINAVNRLSAHVSEMGGEPDTTSGAWGTFANAVQGAANMFGEESAIKGLKTGEESGLDDYQDALRDNEVLPDTKNMIREELLPATASHISTLERLEEAG
jgi:uncharacterized protein (TIGR02284 family)